MFRPNALSRFFIALFALLLAIGTTILLAFFPFLVPVVFPFIAAFSLAIIISGCVLLSGMISTQISCCVNRELVSKLLARARTVIILAFWAFVASLVCLAVSALIVLFFVLPYFVFAASLLFWLGAILFLSLVSKIASAN